MQPRYNTPPHPNTQAPAASGEYRLSTSWLSRPKVAPRTADSRFSQHFSVAGTHAQRSSRYSERGAARTSFRRRASGRGPPD